MAIRFLNSQSIDGELTVTDNVGIGTTSPNSRLEVSDTFPVLRLTNESVTSTIGDVVSSIEFYNSDTSGNYPAVGAAIKSINESTFGNANALGFFTNSDSASESEHMRIDSSGNVGIGTTSPSLSYGGKGLQIQNTDTAGLRLTDTTGSDFDISARSGDVLLYEGEGNPIRIGVGGNEKMRITNDGNVGIGNTNPNARLTVQTSATEVEGISVKNAGNTSEIFKVVEDGSNNGYVDIRNSSNTTTIHLDSSTGDSYFNGGNVGIGTTSPNSELHIASGNPVLTLQDTNSNDPNAVKIEFTDQIDDVHAEIGLTAGNSGALNIKNNYKAIDFYTGTSGTSTLAMQIDDNGFVGIGITNPTATLHVNGGLRVATVNEATTYAGDKFLVSDAENVKYVDAVQLASLIDPYITSGGKFVDGTDTNDAVYTTGNVGIGTTSPDSLLHISQGVNSTATNLIIENTDATILTTEDLAKIEFKSNDATTGGVGVAASIRTVAESAGALYGVGFNTKAGAAETEKMRITAYGNVGIGIVTPNDKLEVVGAINAKAGNGFKLGNSNETAIGKWYNTSGVNYLEGDSTRSFQIGSATNGINVRFDNANNRVGIGTTSPNTLLEIASGGGTDAAVGSPTFRINNTTQSSDWDVGDVVGGIEYYSSDLSGNAPYVTSFIKSVNENNGTLPSGALTFGTATYNAAGGAIERLRITNDGDVGIGTTIPDQRLDLQDTNSTSIRVKSTGTGATDNAFLRLEIGGTTAANAIAFGSSSNAFQGQIRYLHQTNDMIFHGNGNLERMRINSSGNVGIGTTSPTSALSINGVYTGEYPIDSGLSNVVMGSGNVTSHTSGSDNFIAGAGNLTLATTISNSTSSGYQNAPSVSTSSYNSLFGYRNMYSNTGASAYNTMAGFENLYNTIDTATAVVDNIAIGRKNGYTTSAGTTNATLLGRENAYLASEVGSSTMIGWRNCYYNTNAVTQNTVIGYGNMYNVDAAITYNTVMGYYNAYNATDVDHCNLFGYQNAYNAGNLDYTSLFGRENGYSSSGITYSVMAGLYNARNATSTITESALFGRQNAENGFSITYSILSGRENAKAAEYVVNSAVFGQGNAINSSSVQNSFISGYRNAYTTTLNSNYSMLVGYQNGYSAGSLNNTILLGYRQGYSTGSQGAAAYRLAIGMYQDNPLIYGEFENEVVKINGSLTVTDRTGGAATKSAFFDSTGQLIEGDPASTISFAISDETSDLTVGSGKLVFRMPYAMTITDVRASVTTPPTGSTIIVDVNQGGSSIFTTNLLSIDAGEKTSTTAATPPNITTTALTDDAEIIVNIDQVGSTVAGTGLKVYLIGTRA